jgi:hypothetical protein
VQHPQGRSRRPADCRGVQQPADGRLRGGSLAGKQQRHAHGGTAFVRHPDRGLIEAREQRECVALDLLYQVGDEAEHGGWVIIAGIGRANLFDHVLDNRRQLFTEIEFGSAERLSKRPDHGWIDRTGLACGNQPPANHLSDVQGGLIARLDVKAQGFRRLAKQKNKGIDEGLVRLLFCSFIQRKFEQFDRRIGIIRQRVNRLLCMR